MTSTVQPHVMEQGKLLILSTQLAVRCFLYLFQVALLIALLLLQLVFINLLTQYNIRSDSRLMKIGIYTNI